MHPRSSPWQWSRAAGDDVRGETCVDTATFGYAKGGSLRNFMKLGHGIPSHDGFPDLFRRIDPDGLSAAQGRD